MVARIKTVAFQGMDVQSIDVQVQIAAGMPAFTIVGLPDKAIAESKERVRSALHALGIALPPKRLTVNLAPADVAKEGSHYDLPIALGLLAAMEILPKIELEDYVVLGELALDAGIRAVAGVLPAALHAATNDNRLICPEACGAEAVWAGDLDVLAPRDLLQIVNHFKGTQVLRRPEAKVAEATQKSKIPITDMASVRGQETARRALEIAAAGGHNLLMSGPPGAGKSLLASCLPGILPPLNAREALEVSMIHSLAGTLPEGGLIRARPFRDPHHSASLPALVGGGIKAKPGEISLAHHGVLFLDELPEFTRPSLEALRQPLETGRVMVARVNHHVTWPARVQLIAAMNPCRCGWLGDPSRSCARAPKCAGEYQSKISGPVLDRIDLQIEMSAVTIAELGETGGGGENSATVAARVAQARAIQSQRFAAHLHENSTALNAHAPAAMLDELLILDADARAFLNQAAEALKLTARSYHRLIRVARTIADLQGGSPTIPRAAMAEAVAFRQTGTNG